MAPLARPDPAGGPAQLSNAQRVAAGCLSGATAALAVYPMETLRTQMSVGNHPPGLGYAGLARSIIRRGRPPPGGGAPRGSAYGAGEGGPGPAASHAAWHAARRRGLGSGEGEGHHTPYTIPYTHAAGARARAGARAGAGCTRASRRAWPAARWAAAWASPRTRRSPWRTGAACSGRRRRPSAARSPAAPRSACCPRACRWRWSCAACRHGPA